MTFQWYNLLAADDDGLVNILVVVVLAVIGLIGHFIKKAQEKRQVDEANRKVAEAKQRRARQVAAEGRQVAPQAVPGGADSPPRLPPTPVQQAAAAFQSAAATKAAPPFPPDRRPVAEAKPQPVRKHADLAEGVRDEVRKVRQHLSTEETARHRRLAHIKELKSNIAAETPPAETAVAEGPKIRLNLTSPKAARTAIICAEILGTPKALRTDPEPWER